MHWLPPIANFRQVLADAQPAAAGDAAAALQRLASLSQHRLNPVEVIQLDRAAGRVVATLAPETPLPGFATFRLAIVSSFTVEHVLPAIRVAALGRGLLVQTHTGNYGQYRQDILDPASALRAFRPQAVLFCIAARDAIGGIALASSASEADAQLDGFMAGLGTLWHAVRSDLQASVIQQTFLDTSEPLFGSHEQRVPGSPACLTQQLNLKLAAAAANHGVALLDIAAAAQRDGLDAWFDTGRWLQAKMEIAPAAAPAFGERLARVLGALRGLSKKCLVLDLDNTLWGGVIGDDGLEGIVLGEGSAAGEAHLALQRYAQQLSQRGIILAVCSKNAPAIAEQAFAQHPEMLLKREQIACFMANWEPKEANLRRIAQTLNIGLDSLVFVDDNPAERAHIRQALPMVAVPELPPDPALFVRCLAAAGYFEAVSFTDEDRQRGAQYAGNAVRAAVQQNAGSLENFLQSLRMRMQAGRARDVDMNRVAQLINKTNQFNPTTRRHSLETVAAYAADPANAVLQFRLEDHFGDNGLVSAMILLRDPLDPATLEIDTWVMSCRVFGRQLEWAAMNVAVETALGLGARRLRGSYIPTDKNAVVAHLYAELGFEPVTGAGPHSQWQLDLERYCVRATHIERHN